MTVERIFRCIMLDRKSRRPLTLSVNRYSIGFVVCIFILATVGSCQRTAQRHKLNRGVHSFGNPDRPSNVRTFDVSSLHISYQVSKDHSGGWHRIDGHSKRYHILGDGWSTSQRYLNVEEQLGNISNNRGSQDVNTVEYPESGELIRLRSSRGFINSGLVEVYRAGKWGYVCDHRWNLEDATVACRQLGFTSGALAHTGSNESLPHDKYWTAEILMDDTRCLGNERTLQECPYKSKNNCGLTDVASVTCADNVGCPDGWQSGFGKCYTFYTNANNFQQATNYCADMNASLVNIDSYEENHFLSNILKNSMPVIHQWYTGGRKAGNVWKWEKRTPNNLNSRKRNVARKSSPSLFRTVRSPINQLKWFPGWPSHNNLHSEPADQTKHECLTLSDQYKDTSNGITTLDYFFWKADLCMKPGSINFICQYELEVEQTSKVKECYIGKGLSYRGFASVTEKGTRCLSWAGSSKVNDKTHPRKGLGYHNYCRNPDGDSRPWCWIDHDKNYFRFCNLQKCSDIVQTTATVPFINVGSPLLNCPKDEFYCVEQKICIPGAFRCDNSIDCTSGEDEQGCEYALTKFHLIRSHTLVLSDPLKTLSFASYIYLNEEKCAKMCMASRLYICRSFFYNSIRKSCHLSKYNFHNGKITHSPIYDYYELTSQSCPPEKFKCKNKFCVKAEVVCDRKNDCADNSDELSCNSVLYRLVNGSSRREGRLEVIRNGLKGTVCDDSWDEANAAVICRKMGFRYGGQVMIKGHFGEGAGPIWLDNVRCNGKEDSLENCAHEGWGKSDCDHSEDVGVKCYLSPRNIVPTMTTTLRTMRFSTETTHSARPRLTTRPALEITSNSPLVPFTVSLTGGSSPSEGDVIVTFRGVQYRICDDEWDVMDANVICNMLNYSDGGLPTEKSFFESSNSLDYLFDNVECKGTESHISLCVGNVGTDKHDCIQNEAAGVQCKVKAPVTSPPGGTVKPNAGGQGGVCGYKPYDHKDLYGARFRSSPLNLFQEYDELSAPRVIANQKIVGGSFVIHGSHPWQVRIERILRGNLTGHHCGGAILNEYWILSAAHCFTNKRKSELNIYVGDHHLNTPDSEEQKFEIDQLIPHEQYIGNQGSKDYDIALIKIKPKFGKGIVYSDFVQPVCLPDENTPYEEGTMCSISGWGNTRTGRNEFPKALKAVDIPLVNQRRCFSAYKKGISITITSRMFCAGYMTGGKGTCQGDSGGPLVCKINDVYTLLGVTSWGRGCALPNYPGVYANVRAYLDWIRIKIDTLSQSSQEKMIPRKS